MSEKYSGILSRKEKIAMLIGLFITVISVGIQILIYTFSHNNQTLTTEGTVLFITSYIGIVVGFLMVVKIVVGKHLNRLSYIVTSFMVGCFIGGLSVLIVAGWSRPWVIYGAYLYTILIYAPAILVTLSVVSVATLKFSNKVSFIVSVFSVVVTIIILTLILVPTLSPIRTDRECITALSFSTDGNKLLLTTGDCYSKRLYIEKDGKKMYSGVLQIWDIEERKKIHEEFPGEDILFGYTLSPCGRYYVVENTIYNSTTGEIVTEIEGEILDWSEDGKYLVAKDPEVYVSSFGWTSKILFLQIPNFSIAKEIEIPEIHPERGDKFKLSPGENFLSLWYNEERQLMVFSIEENTSLWKKSLGIEGENLWIHWSTDEKLLQIIKRKGSLENTSYNVIVINATDGKEIQNISLYDDLIKDEKKTYLLGATFGRLYFCTSKSYLEKGLFFNRWVCKRYILIYNLTGLKQIINITGTATRISLSKGLIAVGYDNGIVDIFNESTGKLIFSIKTPVYNYKVRIPAPGIPFIIIVILLVYIIKKKWRSYGDA